MIKRILPAAVFAAVSLMGTSAHAAFAPFTVNEGVVAGAAANVFTAGKLNGGFTEALTITGPNTFSASAFANIGQYFDPLGALQPSQVGPGLFGANNQYQIYAVFSATGTFAGNSFTGVTGSFDLYIDQSSNTVRNLANPFVGTAPVSLSNTGDDLLVGSTTTLLSGVGELDPTPPNAFDFIFDDLVLTAFGKTYFTAPNPFYLRVRVNGDTDGALLPPVGQTLLATGDVSAEFKVPEPTALSLVGLALVGAGVASRRRATKA